MERVAVDGVTLAYEVAGSGEPAILIHGALFADSFRPLLNELALADRYRIILYHRRGYGNSSHGNGPISFARQAADCRAVLCHLGIERAHVVGESLGGCIALQLALDAPDAAHTLALLEPALAVGATGPFLPGLARAGPATVPGGGPASGRRRPPAGADGSGVSRPARPRSARSI